MNVLVTGTRKGRVDVESFLEAWLALFRAECPDETIYLRHGNARGVDRQAVAWARAKSNIVVVPYDAEWGDPVLGVYAGHARNQLMVDDCEPGELCIAFPGRGRSSGTWDCVRRARRRRMEVVVVPIRWQPPLRLVVGGN